MRKRIFLQPHTFYTLRSFNRPAIIAGSLAIKQPQPVSASELSATCQVTKPPCPSSSEYKREQQQQQQQQQQSFTLHFLFAPKTSTFFIVSFFAGAFSGKERYI